MMSTAERKAFDRLKKEREEMKRQIEWIKREMKSGLQDIIERVVKENIEIDVVEKTTDEQIGDLIK